MTIAAGTRLGTYEVVAPIGAGGMGEVYRARDPRLARDVAIKVLPEDFLEGEEKKERFEREAKLLAALNHPNIAAVFAFEESAGRHILVMELLEGETLRAKLAGGAIPPRKAVDYALQMAQGLAAAHDKGIVHRDLKPENVFVTKDGRVKILDFGLARQAEPKLAEKETSAPTAARHTDPGTVMGTVGYMSPEQVKGLVVDNRSDLFAFGAILHELLSGRGAFKRDTPPETLTAILREEPADLSGPSRIVDPALERLVRHCLEKSPEERFQSARDLAYALSTLSSSSGALSGATGRVSGAEIAGRRFPLAIAAGVVGGVLLGALVAGILLRPKPAEPPSFRVLTYSGNDLQPSASHDGKTIAFASDRDGAFRIWLKQRSGGGEAVLTAGPEGTPTFLPRFSPDGSSVLFVRGGEGGRAIYRMPLVGGEARKIVGPATEADWSPDGQEIGFLRQENLEGKRSFSVRRVAADGTNDRLIASVADRILSGLRWSPDGLTLAALESPGTGTNRPRIALFPLDGKAPRFLEAPRKEGVQALAWNGDGRQLVLLCGGSDTVLATRTARVYLMDSRTGKERVLLSGIDLQGAVEVVGPGSLLLVTGGRRSNLREISLTRSGEAGRWLTRGSSVDRQPTYSPDGEWVAFTSNRSGNNDVWEVSTKTGAVRRLTDDPADDFDPAFTHDGRSLLFSSNRSGHFEIWIADRDGSGARRVSDDGVDAENPSASPDGRWIVYASGSPEKRGIWKIRPDGSAAVSLAAGSLVLPEISPDGDFVSYVHVAGLADTGAAAPRGTRGSIRVVRLLDGSPVLLELEVQGWRPNTGRHRWLPGGGALAFAMENEKHDPGIAVQDFAVGRDSAATRRLVAGFTRDSWPESLGVSPDGARLAVGELQDSASILVAEGVEGVVARPARGAKEP